MELARVAEDHSGAAVHGLDDAADLDVHVAIFSELTDFVAIFPQTDNGEAALLVRGLGRAHVKERRAIGKLHHIIDMRGDANVFVEEFRGFVCGDAGLGRSGEGRQGHGGEQKD